VMLLWSLLCSWWWAKISLFFIQRLKNLQFFHYSSKEKQVIYISSPSPAT